MEQTPQYQKEILIAYIEREREPWLEAKRLDERSAHMNKDHIATRAKHAARIDELLDCMIELDLFEASDERIAALAA